MQIQALEDPPVTQYLVLMFAVLFSIVAHIAVAIGVQQIEPRIEKDEMVWVEMAVNEVEAQPEPEPEVEMEPEPEPEPEVEPEPEPEPEVEPEVEPEPVEFEETTEEPPPEPPPEQAKPVRRLVQGLSNSSFAEGAGTGLTVRAGTTTSAKATEETMGLDEAEGFAPVAYTSTTTAPKVRAKPVLTIPDEIIDAEIQGRVEVELTIDATGKVVEVLVLSSLHPAADAACIADLKKTRWKPGSRDGTPVPVKGVPYSCRYEMAVD